MRTTAIVIVVGMMRVATGLEITGLTGNGEITWVDEKSNGTYAVEWRSSLTQGDWSRDWSSLTQIAATGGTMKARIPMFFRVVHRPRRSQSADMMLVSGGGQPNGPAYDFYMSAYEVRNEDFAEFLNDAQAQPGTPRGANMFFAANGDVYMDASLQANEKLFGLTESALLYNPGVAPGLRYSVNPTYLGHPVVGVSWYGALKYCNWLTIRQGRGESQRCYAEGTAAADWQPAHLPPAAWLDGFGYFERLDWVNNYSGFRLPMDDYSAGASPFNEYYKAAAWNGSSNTTYGFGRNTCDGRDANSSSYTHPWASFTIRTTPVGYYDGTDHGGVLQTRTNQNVFGIFDLSGNAREWTSDASTPANFTQCSARGGTAYVSYHFITCTERVTPTAADCKKENGFRVVSSQP